MRTPRLIILVGGLIALAFVTAKIVAQESANYRLERITIAATADPVSSASYAMTVTFAQEGPVDSISRCNDSYLQSTGYWSVLGETPVPVFLRLDRNDANPALPDLMWTGSASEFTVYRSASPIEVVDPVNEVASTTLCAVTDVPPPAFIVYYLVLPTGN